MEIFLNLCALYTPAILVFVLMLSNRFFSSVFFSDGTIAFKINTENWPKEAFEMQYMNEMMKS
jgi:hypothetical protein